MSADPSIEDTLRAAGFVPRNPDRPGLWGRDPFRDEATGRTLYREILDIDCPFALSGAISPKKRSTPALARHGKHASNNTPGLELAAMDRSLIEVPDLEDPNHRVQMFVAGDAGLLCAKSYKIGERIFVTSRLPRPKDYLDLFLLMDSSDPAAARDVFEHHMSSPIIGASVKLGASYVSRLIRDSDVHTRVLEAGGGRIPPDVTEGIFANWCHAFPRNNFR